MAAYAALTSLMNLIDQIRHHPQPPITLDKEQTQSLTEKIAFLQDFLEAYNRHYSNQGVEQLRIRIADAAYAAEDVIESHIVDLILAKREQTSSAGLYQSQRSAEENIIEYTSTQDADKICSAYLYQCLQKVLEEMDLVKKDVKEIKEKLGTQEQVQRVITGPAVSPNSPSTQHNIFVGFGDVFDELLHKLTGQPHSDLQIISISGMGGIGKTTLAKHLYANPLVEHHFHVHAWVIISQEYDIKEILVEVLLCLKDQGSRESLSQISEAQLRDKLYKSLYGRRYLIVMDDMWSNDVWDNVKFYFPRNKEGSRIIVTTRLSNVASYLSTDCIHKMDFLDQDQSWNLFCKTVFREKDCPPELEDIGMEIARNCKGLPLSIVVLGGLLAKSDPTREYWKNIAENLSSNVHLEEHEWCLQLLYASYEQLPVHLKACFLYMGTFREDSSVPSSELINMWVAEGFLKPISGKSLEESGEEYLTDLIDRNLILVGERRNIEMEVFYSIHDLLRDICIREARKEKFVFSSNQNDPEGIINTQRRIVIDPNHCKKEYLHTLQSASAARSLICYFQEDLSLVELRLLRVLKKIGGGKHSLGDTFPQVNLRYVAMAYCRQGLIPISLLWNLQTLIISMRGDVALPEIWRMPLLRHIDIYNLTLPDPPSGEMDEFVLHNLHTLSYVANLKLGEEVVKRIPNVKKLKLLYDVSLEYCCLNNLRHLDKLEYLKCISLNHRDLLQNAIFPHSLKELFLQQTNLSWEDINTKIGSLPNLQSLVLLSVFFRTPEWETIEGQFCSLKCMQLRSCSYWKYWTAEGSHFPRLEHLVLDHASALKEIPSCIADIPTLKSIELDTCSYSAIISAKQIVDEQEELGNESLLVKVTIHKYQLKVQEEYQGVESLASHNFQVKIRDS